MTSHSKPCRAGDPNAHKKTPARGGAHRNATQLRTMGRPYRHPRNADSPVEVDDTPLGFFVIAEDGALVRPTVTVVLDAYTRQILGWHMS